MLIDVIRKEQAPRIALQPEQAAPVVSIFMPFDPKMVSKNELSRKLQLLQNEAEQQLLNNFSIAAAQPVIDKLKQTIKNLDYSTHKKSVAIYASAKGEKVFYLDTPLEEKVVIDTTFNIRLLVESKKNTQHYLVLVLSNNLSKVYFGNGGQLVSMLTNTRKKSTQDGTSSLENFLTTTDNNLNIILNYFPTLPLFVLGNADVVNKYKIVTKNQRHIHQLVELCSNDVEVEEIKTALQPYVLNWNDVQMKHLHHQLKNALENGKIAIGIANVIKAARQRRAKLLVLPKDYSFPAVQDKQAIGLFANTASLTDVVDEVIERVLLSGGEVIFEDKNALEDYQQIALIY